MVYFEKFMIIFFTRLTVVLLVLWAGALFYYFWWILVPIFVWDWLTLDKERWENLK